jgi:polysaccharide biosynthesis transport protein
LGTRRFLPMTKAKAGLEEEERQFEAFKIKHVGSTPDQLEANLQALSRLEAELQSNMDAISRLDEERILLSGVRSIEMNETAAPKRPGALTLAEESSGERTLESEAAVQGNISRRCSSVGQLRSVNARLAPMPVSAEDSAGSFDSNTEVRLQLISKGMQRLRRHQAVLQQQIGSYQGKIDPVPFWRYSLLSRHAIMRHPGRSTNRFSTRLSRRGCRKTILNDFPVVGSSYYGDYGDRGV